MARRAGNRVRHNRYRSNLFQRRTETCSSQHHRSLRNWNSLKQRAIVIAEFHPEVMTIDLGTAISDGTRGKALQAILYAGKREQRREIVFDVPERRMLLERFEHWLNDLARQPD